MPNRLPSEKTRASNVEAQQSKSHSDSLSTGNYDSYVQTRKELEENQMKKYRWEQDQIANMKEYIARFGHGSAKLARQAQSKEKTLDKMVRDGLTEKVEMDRVVHLNFENVGKLPPPVLQFSEVAFGYSPERVLYRKVRLLHCCKIISS